MRLDHEMMNSNEYGIINIQREHADSELCLLCGVWCLRTQFVWTCFLASAMNKAKLGGKAQGLFTAGSRVSGRPLLISLRA